MISYRPHVHEIDMYTFCYEARRMDYCRYMAMSDEEFTANLEYALHFAMHICWVKEKQAEFLLADDGVIHELHHLLIERLEGKPGDDPTRLERTRKVFKRDCELV